MNRSRTTRWFSLTLAAAMAASTLFAPAALAEGEGTGLSAAPDLSWVDPVALEKGWYEGFDSTHVTTHTDTAKYWTDGVIPVSFDHNSIWPTTVSEGITFSVENENGNSVMHISSTNANGRADFYTTFNDSAVDYSQNYLLRMKVKTQNVSLKGSSDPLFKVQAGPKINNPIANSDVYGTGTQDWTVYELPVNLRDAAASNSSIQGGTQIKIEVYPSYMTGDVWIDEMQLIPVYDLSMSAASATLYTGEVLTLTVSCAAPGFDAGALNWTSSDDSVATVSAGVVTAHAAGTATITASNSDGDSVQCVVTVVEKGDVAWSDSFETTVTGTGNVATYWKNAVVPANWNSIWVAKAPSSAESLYFEVVEDVRSEGNQAIHAFSTDSSGRLDIIADMAGETLDYTQNYLLRMKVKTDNVQGTGFYARMQVGASRNKNLGDGYKVKGTQDWTTYELPLKNLYTLAEANSGPFKLEIFAEYMTGEFWVDQVEIVPDGYPVRIESDKTSLDVGDTVQLKAASPYQGANLAAAVWASSDADVATVDESGVVTARKPGSATITLDVDGNTAEYTILVSDPKAGEYFASMRAKWSDRMTGNDCSDKTDADYLAAMATYEEAGRAAWESMNKKPVGTDSRTTLWADLNMTVSYPGTGKSDSALSVDLNTASTRILAMARAWAAEGSGLYHDAQLQQDITDALTWFHDHVYNENYDSHKKIYGNWWHWWIGIPQDIGSAVILMYDVLSSELIEQEYLTLCNFNGDPTGIYNVWGTVNTMTGANLADTSLVAALRAAVGNDQEGITLATKHIVTLTGSYVTSGDGFYADGSFIQHSNVAFTSGYGATFLKGIEKILYLADGTSWQIAQQDIAIIYEWLLNAYRPLFADGAMMDLAAGRSVARPSHTDLNTGRGVLETAVLLAASAPEDVKEELLVFLKENLIASASCDESFYGKLAPSSMVAAKNIVNDRSIRSTSGDCYAKVFGAMDKFVAHNDTFSLGISYSSARTARFEVGNQENLQGWHQGDGVTYLYNGDQNQYSGGYWATVDPNRLPGITTDHSEWELDADQAWGKYTGNANFNGGSSAGAYAALAMNFKNYSTADNPNLTARKAWFVFDDEVVALGSGITGIDTSRTTETIVENKKINGDNKLVVDGKATAAGVGDSAELADVHWAWLEGNTDADAVGYYFPEGSSVNVLREERTGSWTDVNGASGVSADPITCTYLSLAVPHGDSVNNKIASHKYEYYDYVLLPGKTQDEVAEYAADPDIEVLCNTNFAQVVRDNKANVTGYIFWGDTSVPLRVADVEALKGSATVVRDPETHTLTIGMADVHQNNASLTFRLYGNDLTLVSADEQVSVETDKYGAKLTVNTQGSRGATFTATFHYEDLSDAEQSELAGIRANYADSLTGNSMKDKSDTEYRAVMDKYAADARDALQHLNADAKPGENLFDDVDVQLDWVNKGTNNTDGSANLTTTANRIYAMALAYASEGCTEYYHNAELKAKLQSCFQYVLDGGLCNILNFQNRVFGNWWDWVIGVPKALAPAALLMYDELDEATRQDLYEYLLLLVPSESYCWMRGASKPYLYQATAANAAELAMITALNGLLGNDPAGLYKASDSLTGSLKYVTSGDGFYEDGSYKQHGNFAYTGSYGAEMLRGVTQIASLTNNTSWACTDADTNIIYEWILEAFRPLYADGAVFDMVQGRSVSRYNRSDWSTGRYIMDAILTLSVNAPAEYRDELLSFAKTQTKLGVAYDAAGYYGRLRFSSLIQAKNLLADESIPLDKEVYTKIYGMMDKAVIHGEGYSLGISMFSVRNGATECGNNENFHGWYTADGTLSLYVNDLNQYGDNYWATVDLLRLAGITTNHVTQSLANFSIKSNDRAWVGGSASGVANHAAVGMDFKSNYSDLEAKKSWFAFGGSVVALGAGIRTTEGEVTETIVDNRKVDSGNTLLVNGSQVIPAEGDSATLNADWAWLSANTLGSSIGYYFPETTALELLREKRTGKWSDINTNNYPGKPDTEAPENTVTNTFVSMAIDHGAKAENGSYAYVLLPGMTQQQTAAFAAENGIVVLSNTETVQAAADTSQGAAGFNFWQSGEVNLPDGSAFTSIRAEGPASVTTSVRNGTLTVGVSDPTQKQSAVRLRLSGEGLSVIGADGRIEAVADTDGVTITVNTSGAAGASAVVTLSVPRKAIVGGVEVPITAEDGEVKIEVSGEEAKEIVSGADTSLTVDVSDVEDLQQITLPGELIDAVLESETVTELTVEGGNVSITLSGSVLETVALAAGQEGYSVSLLVNTASAQDSKLNDAQKEALEELTADALVVDVALLVKYDSGSVELHELGGPVTIRVCYKDSVGENETVYVRYLAEDGSAILLDSAYDAGSGIVTFVTDHFSCYALYTGARQGDAKPTPAPSQKPGQSAGSGTSAPATVPAPTAPAIPATGDNAPIALLIALAALSGLGLAVIGIRRKRNGK